MAFHTIAAIVANPRRTKFDAVRTFVSFPTRQAITRVGIDGIDTSAVLARVYKAVVHINLTFGAYVAQIAHASKSVD
jgi:hypothetical protein